MAEARSADGAFSDRFVGVVGRAASSLCDQGKPLEDYGPGDWVSYILWLDKAGALLPLMSQAPPFRRGPAGPIAAHKAALHRQAQERGVDLLCAFAQRARAEQLRFVALKGAPLASRLYGSAWARHYTDVDVLVSRDDAAKADYVARKSGLAQPAEYFSLRDSGALLRPGCSGWPKAPFLIRHRPGFDTFSDYVTVGATDRPAVLDVHDGICGLDARCLDLFLWGTQSIRLEGAEVNMLSDAAQLAYLVLAAFDDSEGYSPNSQAGMLGFKLYCDLVACLLKLKESDIQEGFELLRVIGKEREAGIVLSNLDDVFPGCAAAVSLGRQEPDWDLSYRRRLVDVEGRKACAARKARELIVGPKGCRLLDARGTGYLRWDVPLTLSLGCEVSASGDVLTVAWELPESLAADIGCFVFQTRLYPDCTGARVAEVRINVFYEEGSLSCFARTSNRISRSGRADKDQGGIRCEVLPEKHTAQGGLIIRFEVDKTSVNIDGLLPTALAVDGGVYKNHYDRIYHEIWRSYLTINGHAAGPSLLAS